MKAHRLSTNCTNCFYGRRKETDVPWFIRLLFLCGPVWLPDQIAIIRKLLAGRATGIGNGGNLLYPKSNLTFN
jgi:hypothetical protein